MLIGHPRQRVYLAVGATDLRKAVDGLAAIVQLDFGLNPFVFCKRFFPKVADLFPQYCMSVFLIIAYVSRPRRGRGNRTIAGMCY